ncbi:DUF4844 domain-containing protein [Hymenobacter sp. M29]|uniref:DUF4844 domain-containing protein n=1 Tax=Hymenobacter mellowenesis TaxID=3063995 RepID=A0ABT9AJ91_9BACT|nr:DUF4844 domain-containing protein [Hymenobacter sp. M29]MDO7849422.1 DUF4844 domain-containing protein [Hymenobacter sp. M29]
MSFSFYRLLFAVLSALLLPACSSQTQHPMHVPATAVSQLQAFKTQAKFDADSMYTGAWPAEIRPVLNAVLNQSADAFIRITAAQPTQEQYLQALAAGLAQIDADELDTEDRERVATKYQELMDIVGLPSSEGQLNKFVYGDFLGGLVSESNLPKQ